MQQTIPVPTADPTAILGRRIIAWLIDFMIIGTILVVIALSTFTNTSFGNSLAAEFQCDIINDTSSDLCINAGSTVYVGDSDTIGMMALVGLGYALIVTMLMPGFTGWSPGKLVMGLRVVNNTTFELAGMGPNIGRGFFWCVDSFPWFVPFVGFVVGLASKGHRRVGDMVANTLVVDKSLVGHPMAVAGVNSVPVRDLAGGQPPPPPAGFPTAPPFPPPAVSQPPASPPPSAAPPAFPPEPEPTAAMPEPPTFEPEPASVPPTAPPGPPLAPPELEPELEPAEVAAPAPPQPGIDAPQWDTARDTYIQWDPELSEWMEWNETAGQWIPISQ